jgi:hypothetical protein
VIKEAFLGIFLFIIFFINTQCMDEEERGEC